MQKEIRKRVQVYAVAAVLLAVIFGSVCYNLGFIPEIPLPPLQLPILKTFSSYAELKNFLASNSKNQNAYILYDNGPWKGMPFFPSGTNVFSVGITQSGRESMDSGSLGLGRSTTNIQVAGVDEADIVKNDGDYIYAVSGNVVFIVKAALGEAGVVSRIVCDDFAPAGIFVSGDRLVVLGSRALEYSELRVLV